MRPLYAEIHPYATHQIKVDNVHEIYVEESGDPNGIPVLFIHGGPGGGCDEQSRRFFDPERYRIICFDQRGSGRSKPFAELENNTSQHLVDDIEKIRNHLNINHWMLFGGSWGSTLALLYAQTHPNKILSMILRGIFLCRDKDIRWLYQEGASRIFPDEWKHFLQPIPESERDDMVKAYYKVLTSQNELKRMSAAKAWSGWEGVCSTLKANPKLKAHFSDPHVAMAMARIEAHFFINKGFIERDQILENIDKVKNIPAIIIHGRYDMVCPLDNALDLYDAWENTELHIVREAGHSAFEPAITDALIKATDTMAERLGEPQADA